ncbi:MAG: hypothetical protein JXP34_03970 [Planctomycetes bacterium]|nr:hypothetical protein [Planctomycetota bacterium]
MKRAVVLAACLLAPGCSVLYLKRPANPCPDVRQIAVPPVYLPAPESDPDAPVRLGEILGGELVQVEGVAGVVGPKEIGSAKDLDEVRKRAAAYGADAVLAARIIEWDPYYKPRLTVEVAFLPMGEEARDAGYLLALDRSASPPERGARRASDPMRIVRVYDSAEREVMDRVRMYALAHEDPTGGMEPVEGVLRVRDNYFRFACYEILKDLFGELTALRESEIDGSERDAVRGQARG